MFVTFSVCLEFVFCFFICFDVLFSVLVYDQFSRCLIGSLLLCALPVCFLGYRLLRVLSSGVHYLVMSLYILVVSSLTWSGVSRVKFL